jgi:hypothetical protein
MMMMMMMMMIVMMMIMITIMLMIMTIFGYLNIRTYSTIENFPLPREEEEAD